MSDSPERVRHLQAQVLRLIEEGQALYRQGAEEYVRESPRAVENPTTFISQTQDLFRGLVLKVLHGVVMADRRLTAHELAVGRTILTQLWGRPFDDRNVRGVLVKHAEQDPYRWEDLLWPFERLPPFRQRAADLQALMGRFARLLAKADGQSEEREEHQLRWIESQLEHTIFPLRADISEDAAAAAPGEHGRFAQQTKPAYAQEEADRPLPVPPELHDLDALLKELDTLIGLAGVKRDVRELVHFLEMQKHRKQHKLPATMVSLHAIFSGNPGTGKTTVARLYGKLLGALGLLKKGHLVETDRGGLVAEYAGQTAGKTAKRIDEALDGVLFIDEAYSLVSEGEDPYGTEAVQTLLKRMEDQRDRLVVILAGYPKPMEALLDSNPGLASRFGRTLTFADYSPVELCRIFHTFCERDHYVLPAVTRAKLLIGFTWHYGQRTERFGNGRLARNVYEASLRRLASRLAKAKTFGKEALTTLEPEDLAWDEVPSELWRDVGQRLFETVCLHCAQALQVVTAQLGTKVGCGACQREQTIDWAGTA
jgi:hypothetical protein